MKDSNEKDEVYGWKHDQFHDNVYIHENEVFGYFKRIWLQTKCFVRNHPY